MFKRLLLDDSTAIVTFVAFVVAASIFITFVWRAIRMNRGQVKHFEELPFETPTPACGPGLTPDHGTNASPESGINPDPQ